MTIFGSLLERYEAVRSASMALAEPLSDEDCCVQSMPDASPIKWHLGHTSWFFETFILEKFETNFKPFHPAFRILFNSYYNGVGARHPRAHRGLITRPTLAEVEDYRSQVDARMEALLLIAAAPTYIPSPELEQLITLGLNHEEQHQELMLTDVLHLLSNNPLYPAYTEQAMETASPAQALQWIAIPEGIVEIGHTGSGFCFDNELPRHRYYVEPFELASRLVNNAEYLAFVKAGAYDDPSLWLAEGWDWLQANTISHPLYWHRSKDAWYEFTLNGLVALDGERAVRHVSFFEAEAYARWAGARLPIEAEWECAASRQTTLSNAVGQANTPELIQLLDTGWQWTSSSYAPYPGFQPTAGAVGEYNGKFMVNQYVLRGGSCATPKGHSRLSYRNFFPSQARWQFSSIRLARSV